MKNIDILSTIIRNHFGKYHPHTIMRESEEAAVAVYKYYQDIIAGAYSIIEETCPHVLTEDDRGIRLAEFTVDNI